MTIRLLDHFNRLIDTPDAVPRLRRFILDLAVRGKLVEQDPKDDPAGELLERIEKQRTRLVKDGKIKEPKTLLAVEQAERPYDIPIGWHWTRLGTSVNSHSGGGTPSKNNSTYWDGNIHWASVKDIGKTKYLDDTIDRITEAGLANSSSNLIPPGNLIVVTRMGLGKISINRIPVAINQDLRALSLSKLADIDFYYIFFKTASYEGSGLTVKGIKVEELLNFPFPLPPLAEQHRIVAKVDELMALCEELEAAQTKREKRRDRLVAATLHGLNTNVVGRDGSPSRPDHPHPNTGGFGETALPGTFEESVRFYFNHLPRLTTRPEHIHQLRQTILKLAVRGKLVPQNPKDKPPVGIAFTKVQKSEIPFEIPESWRWTRLKNLGPIRGGGTPSKARPELWGGEIPWVSPKDMKRDYIDGAQMSITAKGIEESAVKLIETGSILFVVRGMILAHSFPVALTIVPVTVNQDMKALTPHVPAMGEFILRALKGLREEILSKVQRSSHGTCRLESTGYEDLLFPLPPLAEQRRIVAQLDELMGKCDALEVSLARWGVIGLELLEADLFDAITTHTDILNESRRDRNPVA